MHLYLDMFSRKGSYIGIWTDKSILKFSLQLVNNQLPFSLSFQTTWWIPLPVRKWCLIRCWPTWATPTVPHPGSSRRPSPEPTTSTSSSRPPTTGTRATTCTSSFYRTDGRLPTSSWTTTPTSGSTPLRQQLSRRPKGIYSGWAWASSWVSTRSLDTSRVKARSTVMSLGFSFKPINIMFCHISTLYLKLTLKSKSFNLYLFPYFQKDQHCILQFCSKLLNSFYLRMIRAVAYIFAN